MEVPISEKDIISPSFVDAWCELKDKVTVGDMRNAAESGKTPFELIWFEKLLDFGEEKSLHKKSCEETQCFSVGRNRTRDSLNNENRY